MKKNITKLKKFTQQILMIFFKIENGRVKMMTKEDKSKNKKLIEKVINYKIING